MSDLHERGLPLSRTQRTIQREIEKALETHSVNFLDRIDRLSTALGKVTTALHSLQHANDVEIRTCGKGMCPHVVELLYGANEASR